MTTPSETTGTDIGLWTILAGVAAFVFKKWLAKLNPWPLLQRMMISLSEPLMQVHMRPLIDKLDSHGEKIDSQGEKIDHVCKVIDRLPGAEAAHAAVDADERRHARWGTTG